MSFWFTIYLAGAVQAALLAPTLWQRRGGSPALRLLAAWMALLCIDLGVHAWAQLQPPLVAFKPMRLVALLPFLHGSLFYLYVRSVIDGRALRWPDLRHATGFLLALLLTFDLFLLPPADAISAFREARIAGFAARNVYLDIGLYAWSLSYVGIAVLAIRRHRERLRATRSDSHPDALRWLVVMAAWQCAIWAVALLAWVLPSRLLDFRLIYVAVAGWVLLVGYQSLLHGGDAGAGRALDEAEPAVPGNPVQPVEPPDTKDGTGADDAVATGIDDPRSDAVAGRLEQLMRVDALYLEPTLTIARLARRSGYPEYLVSEVINRRFGVPFWDYVNRYRVDAARACLLDADDRRTALEIAYACGFTSKSTFNAAFKRLTGETPSACRARATTTADAGAARPRPPAG